MWENDKDRKRPTKHRFLSPLVPSLPTSAPQTVLEILYQLEMDTTTRMRKQRSHSEVLERKALKRASTFSTSTENTAASLLDPEQGLGLGAGEVLLEESELTSGSFKDKAGASGAFKDEAGADRGDEGGAEDGEEEKEHDDGHEEKAGKHLKEVLSGRGRGSSRLV